MREVVIVDGARSAFTNFGGSLRTLASVDIASKMCIRDSMFSIP